MPLSSLAVFLRSQGPETPGGSWAATAGGLRPRPSGPMAAASDKSGQGSQEHGGCGCPPQCSPERPPLSTTVQCHRRCRRLGFMDTFRPPPQPSRMKLCSVPVTPDPGFPPQGQPLFSLPPAREVRPDAPSGQHSFSPPSSQAPPLPFQGAGHKKGLLGGPPAPRPLPPGSAGHGTQTHPGHDGRALHGACSPSPGAVLSPGRGGGFFGWPPLVSSGVGAQTRPVGAVAPGPQSLWVFGLRGSGNEAVGRQPVRRAVQRGEARVGGGRVCSTGGRRDKEQLCQRDGDLTSRITPL